MTNKPSDMSDKQRRIVEAWISAQPDVTQVDIAREIGVSQSHVSETLAKYSDYIVEEARRRLGQHVPHVDAAMVREALKGNVAAASAIYKRLGIVIDKSESDGRLSIQALPEWERQTLEKEGALPKLPGMDAIDRGEVVLPPALDASGQEVLVEAPAEDGETPSGGAEGTEEAARDHDGG